jgi:hemolysin activation/secretion protein
MAAIALSFVSIAPAAEPAAPPEQTLYIVEYRVEGARLLKGVEVEEAVYPFLGPGRTPGDVEGARAALEKAYKEKGYQTVVVEVPQQQVRGGVVMLKVVEEKVGRLRVHGSRYYSLEEIKRSAPSLAEGTVPNFNDVTRDIVALNQLADRRVTPVLKPGVEPGTVDIDLNVKDTNPLHGSVELNNRYSADTTELRVNGSVSYNNLWQAGHSVGASFQVAPQRPDDAKVFSGYYLARIPDVKWLSVMVQGTKQDSNVSTLGGSAVAGRGEVVGARAIVALPALKDFYQNLSVGIDYKHFNQDIVIGGETISAPVTYYPLSVNYGGTWLGKGRVTELNASVNFHLRGLGSGQTEFDTRRYNADGGYIYVKGDLSHTQDLPHGFQAYGKVQGQVANQPLVDSEEISGGGLGTVRGYLESEVLGDNGVFGTVELRSPSLGDWWKNVIGDSRVYVFGEGGVVTVNDALAEQTSRFDLASVGVGAKVKLLNCLNGSLDVGMPLIDQTHSKAHDLLMTFRVWAEF